MLFAWDLPISDFNSSRSMPAQNAFPAPVNMTTSESDLSISSRAATISSNMGKLSALRLSGRLKVSFAIEESQASWTVRNSMRGETGNYTSASLNLGAVVIRSASLHQLSSYHIQRLL